jgi:hypothetical protein
MFKLAVHVEVLENPKTTLAEYATIPISFQVNSVLDVVDRSAGQDELSCRAEPQGSLC